MIRQKLFSLKKLFTVTAFYWAATMLANVFNWLYNVEIGRSLTHEEFATVTVFLSFQYLIAVPASAITTTMARFTAFYAERNEEEKHFYFFRQYWWLTWGVALAFLASFTLGRGAIQAYFGIDSSLLMLVFLPIFLPIFLLSFEKGALLGRISFGWLGVLAILEAVIKFGFLFVGKEISPSPAVVAVVALSVASFFTWIVSTMISRSFHPLRVEKRVGKQKDIKDTYSYLGNAFFAGVGTVLFYNADVLLAKHYLSLSDAGIYATLSLLGKMLYFGAGSLIPLLIPLTAKAEAKGVSSTKSFYLLLSIVSFVGLSILGVYYFIPSLVVTLLLTSKALVTLPYLVSYALAMLLFVLSSCYSAYHLAKKNYLSSRLMIIAAIIEIVLLFQFHESIGQIVSIVLSVMTGLFVSIVLTDLLKLSTKSISENIYNVFDLFLPFSTKKSQVKKSVLILNWRDTKHVYAGGAELYLHEIASALVKRKFNVTMFTSNDEHSTRYEVINGIHIFRRGGFITVYFWAALFLLTKFRKQFSVIIDSENGIPFFSPLFSKTPAVLMLYHVHQDVFFKHLVPPFSWIANTLETYVMPRVYNNKTVVALSPSTAQGVVEQLEMHVDAIIPTGIDTAFFTPGKKSQTPLISYVGRLKAYKGVQYLITAFAEVVKTIPQARLVIAGDGDHRAQLEALVQKLQLEDVVSFKGKVSENEKRTILQNSWVMVQPSYMEGWGITCLEANACGTPVVATDTAGLKDAVYTGESGFLFQQGNIMELRDQIRQLLSDKKLRKDLERTSREYSLAFSWELQAKKFEKVFSNIEMKGVGVTQRASLSEKTGAFSLPPAR